MKKKLAGLFVAALGALGLMSLRRVPASAAAAEQEPIFGMMGFMPAPASKPQPPGQQWPRQLSRRDAIAIADVIDAHYGNVISERYGRFFIPAMIYIESSGDADAERYESHLGEASVGLMQILPSTAADVRRNFSAYPFDLYDPEANVYHGYGYVVMLSNHRGVGRSPEWVVRAYNGGPGWEGASAKSQEMTANHWRKHQEEVERMKGVL